MILVTGATGSNGSEIIRRLAAERVAFKAMIRKPAGRTRLPVPDVATAIGDFDDERGLRDALAGVDRTFLVTPSSEHVEAQQLRFVRLAAEAGVKHVVYLSQLHAVENSPVRFLRYHAAVEKAIAASGMTFTHLRPNLYMQGMLMSKHAIMKGKLFAPAGDARVSVVDVRDIAAVAVEALTTDAHADRTYDLTGPQSLSHFDLAAALSTALGRPVQFVDIPGSAFRDMLVGQGMPAWQADGLVEDYAHYHRGEAAAVSSDVMTVTGRPATPFESFLLDHRQAFTAT